MTMTQLDPPAPSVALCPVCDEPMSPAGFHEVSGDGSSATLMPLGWQCPHEHIAHPPNVLVCAACRKAVTRQTKAGPFRTPQGRTVWRVRNEPCGDGLQTTDVGAATTIIGSVD